MSSHFRASLLLIGAAALMLAACDREEHHSRAKPLGETVPGGESPPTIFPGSSSPPPLDMRASLYDNNGKVLWVADGYVERALLPQTSAPFAIEIPKNMATKVQNFHAVVNQYSMGRN